jgi:hypothetical protein
VCRARSSASCARGSRKASTAAPRTSCRHCDGGVSRPLAVCSVRLELSTGESSENPTPEKFARWVPSTTRRLRVSCRVASDTRRYKSWRAGHQRGWKNCARSSCRRLTTWAAGPRKGGRRLYRSGTSVNEGNRKGQGISPWPHPSTRGPSNSSRRSCPVVGRQRASSIGVFRIACPIICVFRIL